MNQSDFSQMNININYTCLRFLWWKAEYPVGLHLIQNRYLNHIPITAKTKIIMLLKIYFYGTRLMHYADRPYIREIQSGPHHKFVSFLDFAH